MTRLGSGPRFFLGGGYRGRWLYTISRLGIDEWSVVESCEVCASRFYTNSQHFLVVFMIVRLRIGLRHRLGVSAAFAFSLRHSSVMVHAPLLSHSLRNGKISSKILPETFTHWY
ncbi:hypothetical protein [Rubritalea tangerina]|uniref:hypothetical protein n=1 Tax=Rubritalea tangerina TaxID=430798 RepID=UPI003623301A